MPTRSNGGVFNDQMMTGSLRHYVIQGADFSGALDQYGKPVPGSAAEVIFTTISENGFINIMNPNQFNISFALEQNRSKWDESSLTDMVQSLGSDVGVDHVDCTVCSVNEVPYIWDLGSTGLSFLDLDDTPASYAGAAGYMVTVNNTASGLVFTPIAVTSAFSTINVPSQPSITSSGSTALNIVAGDNVVITTNPTTKTLEISANDTTLSDFEIISAPYNLITNRKYFVSNSGTVTLPPYSILSPGESVEVTKSVGNIVLIQVAGIGEIIDTDIGSDTSIELDVTEPAIFIFNGSGWDLQIGSTN